MGLLEGLKKFFAASEEKHRSDVEAHPKKEGACPRDCTLSDDKRKQDPESMDIWKEK